MLRLFDVPTLFQGFDVVFSTISLLLIFAVTLYAYKVYKLSTERRHLYFVSALGLVVLAQCVKLFMNSVLYFASFRDITASVMDPVVDILPSVNLLYRLVYFVHFVLLLGAWSMIFFLSQPSRNRLDNMYEIIQLGVFASFLAMLSLVATYTFAVYAVSALIMLAGASINYRKQYLNHGTGTGLGRSVLILCVAHALYALVPYAHVFYVPAELLMFTAYTSLYLTFKKVVK